MNPVRSNNNFEQKSSVFSSQEIESEAAAVAAIAADTMGFTESITGISLDSDTDMTPSVIPVPRPVSVVVPTPSLPLPASVAAVAATSSARAAVDLTEQALELLNFPNDIKDIIRGYTYPVKPLTTQEIDKIEQRMAASDAATQSELVASLPEEKKQYEILCNGSSYIIQRCRKWSFSEARKSDSMPSLSYEKMVKSYFEERQAFAEKVAEARRLGRLEPSLAEVPLKDSDLSFCIYYPAAIWRTDGPAYCSGNLKSQEGKAIFEQLEREFNVAAAAAQEMGPLAALTAAVVPTQKKDAK